MDRLPVETYLPRILSLLRESRRLVLAAAPGAGKTTLVPPELMKLTKKRILLIEPRRVAARAAAARIAAILGGELGGVAGYRVRGERMLSAATRIEAVTPGVMLNLLQDDPLLEDVGAVIFDEFHERSAECDLALSFIDDLERSTGAELYLVVMSATADVKRISEFLGAAPVLEVPGRLHPVEVEWSDDAPDPRRLAEAAARAVLRRYKDTPGDVLVFLPGTGEIARAEALLREALPESEAAVLPLHGSLELKAQMRALEPDPRKRRKVILATNVAESSLTVDGVTMVIDAGFERRMVYDPAAGLSRLRMVKITRASAEQRSGRAGRTAPGRALRLWSKFDHRGREEFTVPEILRSELSPLLLNVLAWGSTPGALRWLDPPPAAALGEAEALLRRLGAAAADGGLTPLGRKLARLPVHPRLGAMLVRAEAWGALDRALTVAALLEERVHGSGATAELSEQRLSRDGELLVRQLRGLFGSGRGRAGKCEVSDGMLLAAAFPEWVARRRGGAGGVYRLAGGGAARLGSGDDLERCEFLAVGRLGGTGDDSGVIRLAAPLDPEALETLFPDAVTVKNELGFDPATGKVTAKAVRRFGELVLAERSSGEVSPAEIAAAVIAAAAERGLPIPDRSDAAACRLLERVRFAHRLDPENYPDWDGAAWIGVWSELASAFPVRSFADLEHLPWAELLRGRLGHALLCRLDREYPAAFAVPRGNPVKLDYSQEVPTLAVRIQALYTLDKHPCVGVGQLPLKLELLSPAGRPVQVTSDLPGFWRGSWSIVRKEMKSRYPKHLWPEDPLHP